MLSECNLMAVLNDGVVRLNTSDFSRYYGAQLWTRSKLRKPKKCTKCNEQMAVGDLAFSPITNGYNRMHRICVPCIEKLNGGRLA